MTAALILRYTRSVRNRGPDQDLLLLRLKHRVAGLFRPDLLQPDRIGNDEVLMGGRLGLDSLDALELAICIEEEFGLALCGGEEWHRAFASIASLADFIHAGAPMGLAGPWWTSNTNRWDKLRLATTVFPRVGHPVFAGGANLTF
jgi:acyl carrier protein